MIQLTKVEWSELYNKYCKSYNSNILLEALSKAYLSLEESLRYAYLVELDFGEFIIKNGIINEVLLKEGNVQFREDISYSNDPLALVVENQIEVFTLNKCSKRTRIIKEYSSGDKKSHIVDEREYIVPLNKIKSGDFYGVFGTLDYLENVDQTDHGMDWYAIAGLASFFIDFPFFYSQVKIGISDELKDYFRQHKENTINGDYFPGKEQIDFVRYLMPDFKTKVVYFPRHLIDKIKSLEDKELYLQILKKGWNQVIPLRHNSFENKVLSDILKNISLNNNSDFILRLYDYLRNAINSKTDVLILLNHDNDHFLLDAMKVFIEECDEYFKTGTKYIKPVVYMYDKIENSSFGFLSLNNLPILKNYDYTKLSDVIKDLNTISREFERKQFDNYIIDLGRIDGYGQIDPKGSKMIIKGTADFKKLIKDIVHLEDKEDLKPNFGHFSNSIVINNN